MKRSNLYTISFIFLISVFFTAILASVNSFFLPDIRTNEKIAEKKVILKVLDLDFSGTSQQIMQRFDENIVIENIKDYTLYKRIESNGNILGYATFFKGAGLWGDITGIIALKSDLKSIMGIEFLSHSETPGLGGRIDEEWFKAQFKGIIVSKTSNIKFRASGEGEVDAITGATTTSNVVLELVNTTVHNKLQKLEDIT